MHVEDMVGCVSIGIFIGSMIDLDLESPMAGFILIASIVILFGCVRFSILRDDRRREAKRAEQRRLEREKRKAE